MNAVHRLKKKKSLFCYLILTSSHWLANLKRSPCCHWNSSSFFSNNSYVGLLFLQLPKSRLRQVHKMFHENTIEVWILRLMEDTGNAELDIVLCLCVCVYFSFFLLCLCITFENYADVVAYIILDFILGHLTLWGMYLLHLI